MYILKSIGLALLVMFVSSIVITMTIMSTVDNGQNDTLIYTKSRIQPKVIIYNNDGMNDSTYVYSIKQ